MFRVHVVQVFTAAALLAAATTFSYETNQH